MKRLFQFRRVLRHERPDVVLSFMGEANLINAFLAKRPIVTIHNHLSSFAEVTHDTASKGFAKVRSRFEAAVHRVLIRRLFRRATVVAVAGAVRKELVEYFKVPDRKVVVISNAVNAPEIQKMSQDAADCPWPADTPIIVTAGRLTPVKGQWHLIRAFAESRKRTSCHLAILGAGELEEYLRSLAENWELRTTCRFSDGKRTLSNSCHARTSSFFPRCRKPSAWPCWKRWRVGCPSWPRSVRANSVRSWLPVRNEEPLSSNRSMPRTEYLSPLLTPKCATATAACTPQEQQLAAVMVATPGRSFAVGALQKGEPCESQGL